MARSGGAGPARHPREAIIRGAGGVPLAGLMDDARARIAELEAALDADSIPIRRTA